MSHPHGDQTEHQYQPVTAPVPPQPPAPAAEHLTPYTPVHAEPALVSNPSPFGNPAAVTEFVAPSATPVTTDPSTQPVYPAGSAAVPPPPGYAPQGGTSSFPVTGVPVSGYPVAEPKKKRTGVILLTITTVILALGATGLGALFYIEKTERDRADQKVAEQAAAIEAANKQIKDIEAKLATSKEEVTKLNQDLTGAKNKTDEVTKARDAMAECMKAIEAYGASRTTANATALNQKCSEASKYY